MTQVSAAQVAHEILNQGGSDQQAWVGAALVSGIESSGSSTAKNPNSTACGLFQFLTTTWLSNGGGKYGATACDATWQQQVTVFLHASQGNNFYPWARDLGGSYNGTAIYAPKQGSKVANKISDLAASGTLNFLGNVPSSWADAGQAAGTTGITSLLPGGGSSGFTVTGNPATGQTVTANGSGSGQCTPVIGEGGILGIGSATLLNSCQAAEIVGALLMGVGAGMLIVGITLVVADKAAPAVIGALIPATRAAKSTGTAAKSVTKSTAKRTPSPRQRENALPTRKAGESGEDYSARLKAS
jgi:hypothetical protein